MPQTSRKSGEEFVASLGITTGMQVLDLGCGDGTTALPAARKGADVLGVDIASNLVAAGNARAEAEQLHNIRFVEGDAADLAGIPDGGFDLVISTFGAMFALRPLDVAKEMVRVTRPGGRIVMANWIPGHPSFVAETIRISLGYCLRRRRDSSTRSPGASKAKWSNASPPPGSNRPASISNGQSGARDLPALRPR